MKRFALIILFPTLIISLFGCGKSAEPELILPIALYYHNDLDDKDNFNEVFVSEIREGADWQNDHMLLLNNYFLGPESDNLINPFPTDLTVVSLSNNGNTTNIVLSDQITKLTGMDLTMACSCLSLTLFELTQCDFVEIAAEDNLIADQEVIVIGRESLLMSDEVILPTEN